MIPSFHPVRRQRKIAARARADKTLSPAQLEMLRRAEPRRIDPNSGLEIKTLRELLYSSSKIRYPDMPSFSYPGMLERELSNSAISPFTSSGGAFWTSSNRPRIAVVGGGMSGLLCAWQLRKLGASVDLYEASPAPNGSPTAPQGAGRIRPVTILQGNAGTRAELGAMRFPDTSYLFWHYLRLMVYETPNDLSREFTEFPNPGKVPTYLSGEKSLSPFWEPGGIPGLYDGESSDDVNYLAIQERHIDVFLHVRASNGLTLEKVTEIMLGEISGDLDEVKLFWKEISDRYRGTSYRQFLETNQFSAVDIGVIGYLGVGTGGFAPLFDTSVLEVMRLFIWSYESEFAVPELYRYPYGLWSTLVNLPDVRLNYDTRAECVSYHRSMNKYSIGTSRDVGERFDYDYVVCAMTHKAARNLLSNANSSSPDIVMPYSRAQYPSATSLFRNDIEAQQGLSSVKIFQIMAGPSLPSMFPPPSPPLPVPFSSVAPRNGADYGRSIRVVFGKTGTTNGGAPLGVTYMLPYLNENFVSARAIVGLQYSWGDDSTRLRAGLLSAAPIRDALDHSGVFASQEAGLVRLVTNAVLSRIEQSNAGNFKASTPNVVDGTTHVEYFGAAATSLSLGYFSIVDWDHVPNVNMGFKLDKPGIGRSSIYHFRLAANGNVADLLSAQQWDNATTLDHSVKGLYFCGDSFSHYGGWVEGAFQSALNVTAGIVYTAAKASGRLCDLSQHARDLVTG